MPQVRCADCGYLAIRDRQTRELVEVEVGLRKKWELPTLPGAGFYQYEDFPICLQHKSSLRIEKASYRHEEVIDLLQQERDCDGFMEWQHGFSPKEHQEMQLAQELQRQQLAQREQERDWQDRRDTEQRRWQDQLAAEQREWQARQNRANRVVQIFLAIFAATVTIMLAYYGYAVTRFGQAPTKMEQHAP
ncbi:MAG: hypothetical protein K8U57_27985 [Planctomycetes bacterium]|nr:hypothetical protein [Planctomycetota bacterium]